MDAAFTAAGETAVIRKYANRRLYDTSRAHCVTLADIARRVRAGERVRVVEAGSGTDVTRQVLAQIVCENEAAAGAGSVLDEDILARLIRLSQAPAGGRVAAALTRALDALGDDPRHATHGTRNSAHAAGMIRPRGRSSKRNVLARLDALEARLKSLIAAADAGRTRRRTDD